MIKFRKGVDIMAKYCKYCGAELETSAEFCGKCGKPTKENVVEGQIVNNKIAKSKIAAGLLGIFLGCFGVHNFYLGYTGKAVGQLLLTLLSCGIFSFVSGVWGLIEGILILTGSINEDAEGNRLVD